MEIKFGKKKINLNPFYSEAKDVLVNASVGILYAKKMLKLIIWWLQELGMMLDLIVVCFMQELVD